MQKFLQIQSFEIKYEFENFGIDPSEKRILFGDFQRTQEGATLCTITYYNMWTCINKVKYERKGVK